MSVTFITYAQAAADVREWSRRLPHFDAVCGIPRSGTIIAAMLAEFRNCQLVEFGSLACGSQAWKRATRRCPAGDGNRVLVVDDTCWTGRSMGEAREQLRFARANLSYGALYYGDNVSGVDHKGRRLLTPVHEFEWNLARTCLARKWLFDMDGVLCEDWGKRDIGEFAEAYECHLRDVAPLYRPIHPVRAIVTARLSSNRPATVAWLAKHGIRYKSLTTFPGDDVRARERHGHAKHKAEVYAADRGATLFVESCYGQSREIAERTGRPVLSIERMTLFNGIEAGEWFTSDAEVRQAG